MTAALPNREALDGEQAAALAAPAQAKLIAPRQAFREEAPVLQGDAGRRDDGGVGLVGAAEHMTPGGVRKGGRGRRRPLLGHQAGERKIARQKRGFLLDPHRSGEVGGLVGRLAAVTGNITGGGAQIRPIELNILCKLPLLNNNLLA